MRQQKFPWAICLSFAMTFFVAIPTKANLVKEGQENEITRPATSVKEWLSQSLTPIQIEGVRLNLTKDGIDVILETVVGNQLEGSSSRQGNRLIIDISNAQLQLPEGQQFRQENPIEGVSSIEVINLTSNTVRVIVTGNRNIPVAKLISSDRGLILSLTPNQEIENIELVVTAQKRPENVQNVPISITVIPRQEIEDADITTLNSIAANTPNFSTFTPNRNFIIYSIRGLSNFNFLSRDPIAFYVDDVPYDYTGFLSTNQPDLERVEVLRGPQSTLYGRNAIGGVVNLITRKPTNQLEYNGSISYGNYNSLDLRAGVGGPIINDRLFFRLSGGYTRRDGYLKNDFLNSDVDEESGGTGRAQFLWTPSSDWEIAFNASFDDYQGGVPLNLLGQEPFKVEQDFDGFNNLNSNTQSLRVTYKQPTFRLTSITARRFSEQSFANEADITTSDILTQIGDLDSTVISQEIRLQSSENSHKFQWLIGGYFEERDFNVGADSFRYGSGAVTAFGLNAGQDIITAKTKETTLAVFAQTSYRPIEALTITGGLRYESFNSKLKNRQRSFIPDDGSTPTVSGQFNDVEKDSDIVLPRFIVEYRFNPNLMVYGSITRGYRPPGVNYRANNEDLLLFEAEKSWNYELGLKSSLLNNRLTVNTAFFYNPVDNYQVAVPDATGFFRDVTNAEVTIYGLEVEVKANLLKGLDAIAGFGFTNAEFVKYTNPFTGRNFDGNKLPYAPDFTYNLALQYRSPHGIFARIELQGLGTTFFDEANDLKQGSFALLNARLGYEFERYGIYLYANNITDVRNFITAASFPPFGTFVTYGAPATYGIQFRFQF